MARRPRNLASGWDAAISAGVLALVQGRTAEDALAEIMRAGVPADDAGIVLKECRKRIQIAAEYNREEQLGLAISRLTLVVEKTIVDPETLNLALQAQKELNKLLRLHEVPAGGASVEDDDGADRSDELARVREHLAGVIDAPADYPPSELARMAAEKIRAAHGGADTPD